MTLSLLGITTILLAYKFLHDEYEKVESLEREQSVLHTVENDLKGINDKRAKELLSRIPQSGTPPNLLAKDIQSLESEISSKQATRRRLWDDHPIERHLPVSSPFRQIATLDIEIALLQQGLSYERKLYSLTFDVAEAERQVKWFQAGSKKLAYEIYRNKNAQWELSKQKPLLWQVPYSSAYNEMKRLEGDERVLQTSKSQHDIEVARWQRTLEDVKKLPRPGPLVLDNGSANHTLERVTNDLAEKSTQLEGGKLHKVIRGIREALPTALGILVLAMLSPIVVKGVCYYVIAPIAGRRPPVRLLPESGGKVYAPVEGPGNDVGATTPSRVSLPLMLGEHSELLILPSHLQSLPLNVKSDTKWLLARSMPLTSLLAGMYRLTRIRPSKEERIIVSSSTDPLAEFSLLDVPAGSALVLQPRCLAGIIQTNGDQLKITRHWRFGSLGAWLTLQFRYIVFHGPATLIVKGCRGVRLEPAINGRTVNQAATLGFSANLDYSVARNETFLPYFFGERELFNDTWRGEGCCIHAATPQRGDHSAFFGRGLQGLVDTFLRIFGI